MRHIYRTLQHGMIVPAAFAALFGLALASCALNPQDDAAYRAAMERLQASRADPQVGAYGARLLDDAERTLGATGEAKDEAELHHLVYLSAKKIDIARAIAERRVAEEKLKALQDAARARADRRGLAAELEEERKQRERREADAARQRAVAQLAALDARETERGTVLTLSDLSFDISQATLGPDARQRLTPLAEFLRSNPERRIVIEGYTDNIGDAEHNLTLSLQRATAVKSRLVEAGIAPDRISAVGHGANYPVASNATSAGRQQNRRVEILLEPAE